MDALTLLKKDHQEVRELFREVEALGERAFEARRKLFVQIATALKTHARIEEEIFYPAFKERTKSLSEERKEVLEAIEEHAIVKRLVAELEGLDAKEETFAPKLQVLMENVEHHAKEEETEMFPMAREIFERDELQELGAELQAAKEAVPA